MGNFTSEIDICNDAIARIGGKFINSIESPKTHTETLMASMYVKNRRIVLRSAVWNFASDYITINKTDEVIEGFAGIYRLPPEFVRFLGITSLNITATDSDKYKLMGGKIGTKFEGPDSITLAYIKDVTEVPYYDALFVEAFSLRLAYNMSYALSGKNNLADRLASEYKDALVDAKQIDGQEQKPIKVTRSKWLQRRRRGGGSQYADTQRYFGD